MRVLYLLIIFTTVYIMYGCESLDGYYFLANYTIMFLLFKKIGNITGCIFAGWLFIYSGLFYFFQLPEVVIKYFNIFTLIIIGLIFIKYESHNRKIF